MIENITEISKDLLLSEAQGMMYNGYRFVTATCIDLGDEDLEVIYHFDKDLELRNLRVKAKRGEDIPSLSKIYFCSALVENEMKELFGLNVTNMIIDYGGHLLLSDDAPDNPMAKNQIIIEQKGDK